MWSHAVTWPAIWRQMPGFHVGSTFTIDLSLSVSLVGSVSSSVKWGWLRVLEMETLKFKWGKLQKKKMLFINCKMFYKCYYCFMLYYCLVKEAWSHQQLGQVLIASRPWCWLSSWAHLGTSSVGRIFLCISLKELKMLIFGASPLWRKEEAWEMILACHLASLEMGPFISDWRGCGSWCQRLLSNRKPHKPSCMGGAQIGKQEAMTTQTPKHGTQSMGDNHGLWLERFPKSRRNFLALKVVKC